MKLEDAKKNPKIYEAFLKQKSIDDSKKNSGNDYDSNHIVKNIGDTKM
jgi:hypothetical protein